MGSRAKLPDAFTNLTSFHLEPTSRSDFGPRFGLVLGSNSKPDLASVLFSPDVQCLACASFPTLVSCAVGT